MMIDHEEEIKHEEQIDKQEQQQSGTLKKSTKRIFDVILTYCLVLALNDKEILGQALIFLVAGYETTSVLMSFFFYVMATEPVIQEKIYEEIQQEIGDVSEINIRE